MTPVLSGDWNFPTRIWHGPGAVTRLAEACKLLGIARPLLLTDRGLHEGGHFVRVMQLLQLASLSPIVSSSLEGTPTLADLESAAGAFRDGGCDGVIALGGGSVLDAGKCIGFAARQNRPFAELASSAAASLSEPAALPVIAIPTTAGTGSEASWTAIIADAQTGAKTILTHPRLLPAVVLSDPELTVDLPPQLTAFTGLAALSHCVEAYCAAGFHPLADAAAVEGVRLIADHLPTAFGESADLEARSRMLAASTLGAAAAQKGLGPVQAFTGPVGGPRGLHYGLISGVLLPYALVLRRTEVEERLAYLAVVLGLPGADFDAFIDWLTAFRAGLNVPHGLAELGIHDSEAASMADQAGRSFSAPGEQATPLTGDDLHRLLHAALRGDLALAA